MGFENLTLSAFTQLIKSNLDKIKIDRDVNTDTMIKNSIIDNISIFFNDANGIDDDMTTLNKDEFNKAITTINDNIANMRTEARNKRVEHVKEQAKSIIPYNENGQVNGSEWVKALLLINDNLNEVPKEELEVKNKMFEEILSAQGQVIEKSRFSDGGSDLWKLEN